MHVEKTKQKKICFTQIGNETMSTEMIRYACDGFFEEMGRTALSYNDVLLIPNYADFLPEDACLHTQISRNITAEIPVVGSPMDTVSEEEMAIALARLGGVAIVHRNLSPEAQAKAIAKVKHHLSAFVSAPICIRADQTVAEVLNMAEKKGFPFRSFPVLNDNGIIVGIVSTRDFEFCTDMSQKVSDIMVKDIISAAKGTDVQAAYDIMKLKKVKILPIFGQANNFEGIFTWTDAKRIIEKSSLDFNLAPDGTLRVGAAVGAFNDESQQRMKLLAEAGVDLVVIDTSKGDSANVLAMVKYCKENYSNIDVVAGNIATAKAAKLLAIAGVDGVRVGVGPGSICTTRVISGVGVPQLTAVYECAKALRGTGIPVWADGGITQSGDIPKALAAGADAVMLGRLLACTTEAPGEVKDLPGGIKEKVYRGMGSQEAMVNKGSQDRYKQTGKSGKKLVPEGVSGKVVVTGDVASVIYQLLGGLRSGMGNVGTKTIPELQLNGDFVMITRAGLDESHPHDIGKIEVPSNYFV